MKISFEWDATKAQSNFRKHGIYFDEAKTIFSDPLLITYPDDIHSIEEDRFISLGYSHQIEFYWRFTQNIKKMNPA